MVSVASSNPCNGFNPIQCNSYDFLRNFCGSEYKGRALVALDLDECTVSCPPVGLATTPGQEVFMAQALARGYTAGKVFGQWSKYKSEIIAYRDAVRLLCHERHLKTIQILQNEQTHLIALSSRYATNLENAREELVQLGIDFGRSGGPGEFSEFDSIGGVDFRYWNGMMFTSSYCKGYALKRYCEVRVPEAVDITHAIFVDNDLSRLREVHEVCMPYFAKRGVELKLYHFTPGDNWFAPPDLEVIQLQANCWFDRGEIINDWEARRYLIALQDSAPVAPRAPTPVRLSAGEGSGAGLATVSDQDSRDGEAEAAPPEISAGDQHVVSVVGGTSFEELVALRQTAQGIPVGSTPVDSTSTPMPAVLEAEVRERELSGGSH